MEHLDRDSVGRLKRHRLLLSMDDFPTLGRLDFFTMNLRQMAGYGSKVVTSNSLVYVLATFGIVLPLQPTKETRHDKQSRRLV